MTTSMLSSRSFWVTLSRPSRTARSAASFTMFASSAPEVPDAMREALGADAEAAIEPRGEKAHVDLKLLNRIWLQKVGVQVIDVSPDCTMCHPDRFWSHRVTGGARGSQAAIIRLKGGAAQ